MHRRHEMEVRINVFVDKCDHAMQNIKKLKMQAQGFVQNLNCEPAELKERFLTSMKQLDEYTYLLTDFNLAISKLDSVNTNDFTPVHDVPNPPSLPQPHFRTYNLIDALSEPTPSTSKDNKTSCCNQYQSEKPHRKKIPKEDQLLIAFSSTSCSSESVPLTRSEKEVQCQITEETKRLTLDDSVESYDDCKLPAQTLLHVDNVYSAIILYVDGLSFWVIANDVDEACNLIVQMMNYYKAHRVEMSLDELMSLTYCSYYDNDSSTYYRGLFIRLTEEDMSVAELFLVDTGETKCAPISMIQPLPPRFCKWPPFARSCHLAGIDLLSHQTKELMDQQEAFLDNFIGTPCSIRIDDNSSESLDIYVILPSGEILNDLLVEKGLAVRTEKSKMSPEGSATAKGLPELQEENFDITQCPEYDDPLLAVTGYHNRDEIDICKNYKGGPEKTCFKGARCTKRHVLKHPEGWTLDRVAVSATCAARALPAPRSWPRVLVTHVAHFNRFYVHFLTDAPENEILPNFGVVLPPTNLEALIQDMNSPATRLAYKPLKMIPAPGELVAALYPLDEQWYRARVISSTRADQSVEVFYIDYGNVVWVKEDAIRELEPRFWALEAQASRCVLAGVAAKTTDSRQWAAAKAALTELIQEQQLQAHTVARDYDEITVELFDKNGFSIAEQLAAGDFVNLTEYSIIDDTDVKQKIVLP